MFTLFNLQGALGVFHRFWFPLHWPLNLGAELIYLSTSFTVCQELFSKFFKFLFAFVFSKPLCRALAYNTPSFSICQQEKRENYAQNLWIIFSFFLSIIIPLWIDFPFIHDIMKKSGLCRSFHPQNFFYSISSMRP